MLHSCALGSQIEIENQADCGDDGEADFEQRRQRQRREKTFDDSGDYEHYGDADEKFRGFASRDF